MKDIEIIQELESLKTKILLGGVQQTKSDLEKYEEWVDEIMGKYNCRFNPLKIPLWHNPREYMMCKTILNLVRDLYYKKHCDNFEFQENKPEIMRIVEEAVFMTMFVRKETDKN